MFFRVSQRIKMILTTTSTGLLIFSTLCIGHQLHTQTPIAAGPLEELWHHSLPGDGGTQVSSMRELCRSRSTLTILTSKQRPILSSLGSPHLVVCLITNACPARQRNMTSLSWVPPLIPEPHIDLVQDLVRAVSDKGLAVLISSTSS